MKQKKNWINLQVVLYLLSILKNRQIFFYIVLMLFNIIGTIVTIACHYLYKLILLYFKIFLLISILFICYYVHVEYLD